MGICPDMESYAPGRVFDMREGRFWRALGDIIPATWGIEGFVRINNNAATIADNTRPYLWLWGLTTA